MYNSNTKQTLNCNIYYTIIDSYMSRILIKNFSFYTQEKRRKRTEETPLFSPIIGDDKNAIRT